LQGVVVERPSDEDTVWLKSEAGVRRVRGRVPELRAYRGKPRSERVTAGHRTRDQRGGDAMPAVGLLDTEAPDVHTWRAEPVGDMRQEHPGDAPHLAAADERPNPHRFEADPGFPHRFMLHLGGAFDQLDRHI